MEYEIEIKTKVRNKKRLLQKLKLLGARLKNKIHQVDTYYSPGKGERFVSRGRPRLRIRKNLTNGTARLEYHLPHGQHGGWEREITISDGDMMDVILKNLGFKEECKIDKIRHHYKYKDFNLDLDQVKGLGTFFEVELMNVNNRKRAVRRVKELIKDLGFKEEVQYHNRYLNMMLRKKGLL